MVWYSSARWCQFQNQGLHLAFSYQNKQSTNSPQNLISNLVKFHCVLARLAHASLSRRVRPVRLQVTSKADRLSLFAMRLPINEQISQSSFIFYLVDYDLYFIIDAFPLGVTDKKNIKSITSLLVTQQLVSMTLIMTFHASR